MLRTFFEACGLRSEARPMKRQNPNENEELTGEAPAGVAGSPAEMAGKVIQIDEGVIRGKRQISRPLI